MGTEISVELWRYDKHFAQAAIAAVKAEMHCIDKSMSPYIETSELALINREASKHPVKISTEMMAMLQQSLRCSMRS